MLFNTRTCLLRKIYALHFWKLEWHLIAATYQETVVLQWKMEANRVIFVTLNCSMIFMCLKLTNL